MSAAVERAFEVLGRHLLGPSHPERERRGRWTCRCGAVLARIQDGQEALHQHQAEMLRDAGIIPDGESETQVGGYVVLHDYPYQGGWIGRQAVSSVYEPTEAGYGAAENQLAYCEGMQERERPGSEGRYLIAEVREVPDA